MERCSSESLDKVWRELEDAFARQHPVDVVENIINKSPMVLEHRFDYSERTPLHQAVELQNSAEILNVIELLVQRGKKALKMADKDGNCPIHSACCKKSSSLEMIQLLIDSFPDSVRIKGFLQMTPLHFAVCFGLKSNIINFLFDLYPEATAERNGHDRTPLHFACLEGTPRQEVVELLLPRNSECIHVPDKNGFTPLSYLCRGRKGISRDIIQIIYEACPKAARKKVGSDSRIYLNAFHLACNDHNGHCTPTAVQFFCEIDPCLFIAVHDESSMPWDTFYQSLKESFEKIKDDPRIFECVQHAAVSLVKKLVHREQKPLSHMEADVAEHLVELLETRPFPMLQEVNTPNDTAVTFAEVEIFQELQDMLCSKRFQGFLQAFPILLEARRDPENKAKAVVAMASVNNNNNFYLLFHQLRKNPFINNQKKRKQCARQFGSNEKKNPTKRGRHGS